MPGSPGRKAQTLADDLQKMVDRCLAGDEIAARQFVERYQRRVFGLCWRMLCHRQDAEDAAQETFVRALDNLARWDRNRPLEPWLMTIAANRCRTVLAKRARRPVSKPLEENTVTGRDDTCIAARQLAEELERALAELRPQYALAFRLFHEEQLSYAEIASAFERPIGTVKTWVHRARRGIVEQLATREVINQRDHGLSSNRKQAERIAG